MGRIELRADSGHVFTFHVRPEGPREVRAWGDGDALRRLGEKTVALENAEAELRRLRGRK